ncbi:hypothetical protein H9L15_11105 [Sphingomonas daechungensis]|uniref:Sulfotransferase n=1 Tax=Sphingomonas daechungensis TaxID=1176646 RepID=A0ABX6SYN4_9SPHN|nr:hypothetical protein H9L15_11105 [Sphingomonas daechungensis]
MVSTPRSGSTLLYETLEQAPGLYSIGDESHRLIETVPGLAPQHRGWSSNRLTAIDATADRAEHLAEGFYRQLRDRDGNAPAGRARMLEKTPRTHFGFHSSTRSGRTPSSSICTGTCGRRSTACWRRGSQAAFGCIRAYLAGRGDLVPVVGSRLAAFERHALAGDRRSPMGNHNRDHARRSRTDPRSASARRRLWVLPGLAAG